MNLKNKGTSEIENKATGAAVSKVLDYQV